MADLDIVRDIENELNLTLVESDDVEYKTTYTLNEDRQVTGFGLYSCEIGKLGRIIPALQALPQLHTLHLSYNQIGDASFLKELSQLQYLNLSNTIMISRCTYFNLPKWGNPHQVHN